MHHIIDSHIHLFNLLDGEYHWLKTNKPPFWPDKNKIARNFTEHDLKLNPPFNLQGFVHIEAGFDNQQPWREITWLEQHCQLPFSSVAYLDINLPESKFQQQLQKLITHSSVVAIRDILDDNSVTKLSNINTKANFAQLNQLGLGFEIQISFTNNTSIDLLANLVSNNANINFVINHAGWPPIDTQNQYVLWQNNLAKFAQYNNVAIKCSGWEMNKRNYQVSWVNQCINACINIFGLNRVMLASNFPLVLFSHSYQNYWQLLINSVDSKMLNQLINSNAKHWYKVPV